MIEIIKYTSTSLMWGLLLGVFCLGLFFFTIKGWWKDVHYTFKSYLTGCVLGLILIYQCILLCGGVVITNMVDDCEPIIASYVNKYVSDTEEVLSKEKTDEVLRNLVSDNPLVARYVDTSDFKDCSASELPSAVVSQVKGKMRWFIVRRILWCVGFSIIAAILVIKNLTRQQDRMHENISRDRKRVKRNERSRINRYRR